MKVAISRLHYPVTALGPGKRVGLWLQGCSIKCEGCISADTWVSGINLVDITEVFDLLDEWLPDSDGITITGGEPFDQPAQLEKILKHSKKYHHITTFVYSGYSVERLSVELQQLKGQIDLLMADPLDITQSQKKALRGSDNQRLVPLTELGVAMVKAIDSAEAEDMNLNFVFDGDTAWFAGVPKRGDISKLIAIARESGSDAKSVEDKKRNV